MIAWERLPAEMQTEAVRPYYEALKKKRSALFVKRCFDIAASALLMVVLSPVLLVLAVWIRCDSKGPVLYRQERVTRYGKHFRIFKFRTMVVNADKIGALVTTQEDARITRVGRKIRALRLDELPQLINVFLGDMSFVGTRPEVPKYVAAYTDEMWATLLLPAGVTSEASIRYKDETDLLDAAEDVDKVYIERVLPEKMAYNLQSVKSFSIWNELGVMGRTITAVFGIHPKHAVEVG